MPFSDNYSRLRAALENKQVFIYFLAVLSGGLCAITLTGTGLLESLINPFLALMLYVTFLQVPVNELNKALSGWRFLLPLLISNFVVIPVLVSGLIVLLPENPMLTLGVLLVLLAPCIDYVITFTQLGRGDARLLLASTPVLLIAQIVLLPVWLRLFLGESMSGLVQAGPFIHAFVWLIAVPWCLAALTQCLSPRFKAAEKYAAAAGLLPVPATALVLFTVVASMLPQLSGARAAALSALPVYILFALTAPVCGWVTARLFRQTPAAGRAIAFSSSTRNSLVVLPVALAVPDAFPILPAVIVTQTMVELIAELIYVRVLPRFGHRQP